METRISAAVHLSQEPGLQTNPSGLDAHGGRDAEVWGLGLGLVDIYIYVDFKSWIEIKCIWS